MTAKQNSDISHEGWVVMQISVDRAQVFTTVPQQKPGNELVITIKVCILSFSLLHLAKGHADGKELCSIYASGL